MNLLEEFKEQFEEKYKDIIETNFPSIEVKNEDISNCFKDIMINDYDDDVDELINDVIIEWIVEKKETEINNEDRIITLEREIEEIEIELDGLKNELKELKEKSNSWDNIPSSTSLNKNETWNSLDDLNKW